MNGQAHIFCAMLGVTVHLATLKLRNGQVLTVLSKSLGRFALGSSAGAGPEVRQETCGDECLSPGAGENIRAWRSLRSLQELNLKGCYKIEDVGLQGCRS